MNRYAMLTGQPSILSYFGVSADDPVREKEPLRTVSVVPALPTKDSAFASAPAFWPMAAAAIPAPVAGAVGAVAAAHTFNIFCDGACSKNGRRGARGGYGVAVLKNGAEVAALSEALEADEPQTNQRAELRGLQAAVGIAAEVAEGGAVVRIYSDSEYSINCVTRWGPGWRRSSWRKADGGPVLHRDIIEPLLAAWDDVRTRGVLLQHVAAHTGRGDALSRGNARADELATASIG
jgi:ribonuclease HI